MTLPRRHRVVPAASVAVALDETAIDDVSCPHSTCSSPDTLEAHGKAVHASHHTKSGANTTEADDGHPVKQTARAVTPPSRQNASCKPVFNASPDSDWHGTAHCQLEYGNTTWHKR